MKMITDNGISMEFEFDERLLGSSQPTREQRRRFQLYIDHAKSSGLYGKRSFTYFQDHDTIRRLALSQDPEDAQVRETLFSFVADNPLRKKVVK